KLKGMVLGVGTLAVVVSGAVVLAQSQSRPSSPLKPAGTTNEPLLPQSGPAARDLTGKPVSADGTSKPDELDRAAALEHKLDRILDALDRLSRPAPGPNLEPMGGSQRSLSIMRSSSPLPSPAMSPLPQAEPLMASQLSSNSPLPYSAAVSP